MYLATQPDRSVRIDPELVLAIEELGLFAMNRPIIRKLTTETRDKYAATAMILSLAAAQCS